MTQIISNQKAGKCTRLHLVESNGLFTIEALQQRTGKSLVHKVLDQVPTFHEAIMSFSWYRGELLKGRALDTFEGRPE